MWETMHQTIDNCGTVSRLRFCRRSWVFEIHFWWNIVHFGKSYVCSNQLDVETNFSSTRVSTQLFGCRMKDGRYSRSWFVGSDRYSSSQTHASERSRTERPDKFQENSWKDWSKIFSKIVSSFHEALLYIFEDNERVIKMIIKGRSPTMRHVSRTHRVALDWVFDGINFDSKIQVKYSDTENQFADILTKGKFTRDEWWNHLLCLVNFGSINVLRRCRKERWEDAGEEGVVVQRCWFVLAFQCPSGRPCTSHSKSMWLVLLNEDVKDVCELGGANNQFTISCAVAYASLTLRVTATYASDKWVYADWGRGACRDSTQRLFRLPRLTQRPLLRFWWLNTWFQHL